MGERLTLQDAHGASSRIWTQVAVAGFALGLGTLVYVLDRSSASVPFFSAVSLADTLPPVFGRLGESLPTFAHVFAFSLLTAAWLGGGRRIGLTACLAWFGLDTAFEIGQRPQIAERLVQFIPDGFEGLPILAQADSYFLSGTFDTWDLISIAVGAATAYLLIRCTAPKAEPHG